MVTCAVITPLELDDYHESSYNACSFFAYDYRLTFQTCPTRPFPSVWEIITTSMSDEGTGTEHRLEEGDSRTYMTTVIRMQALIFDSTNTIRQLWNCSKNVCEGEIQNA